MQKKLRTKKTTDLCQNPMRVCVATGVETVQNRTGFIHELQLVGEIALLGAVEQIQLHWIGESIEDREFRHLSKSHKCLFEGLEKLETSRKS